MWIYDIHNMNTYTVYTYEIIWMLMLVFLVLSCSWTFVRCKCNLVWTIYPQVFISFYTILLYKLKINIWIKIIIFSHPPISLNQQYSTLKIPYVSQMVLTIKSFLRRPHPSIYPSIPTFFMGFQRWNATHHYQTLSWPHVFLFPFEINDTWHFGWLRLIKPSLGETEGEHFVHKNCGAKADFCVSSGAFW